MAKKSNRYLLGFLIILFLSGCTALEPNAGAVKVRLVDDMVIVYVPSGNFPMGSSEEDLQTAFQICTQYWFDCDWDNILDEEPQHKVFLDGFWIDQTEVTNSQYLRCVSVGACEEPHCLSGLQFNDPEQPVVCVSWYQAEAYCHWAGGRLPTEAEWEYAARGKKGSIYPWGDEFVGEWLNYCDQTCGRPHSDPGWDDGHYYTAEAGTYDKGTSWCQAADLAGNVSEWVGDWYADYDRGWKINPTGSEEEGAKTIKGGSWLQTRGEARGAWRQGLLPDDWYDDLGFRCVIPLSGEP
jgi:formylglycine-generating enzyme required for sulfatase activity